MAVSEGPGASGGAPGLGQLGLRLMLGALAIVVAWLLLQRWGEGERIDRESFSLMAGTIRAAELAAPVEILRDTRGIPHVTAEGEAEGWFGLGFVHGQDRLAQMITLRRRAYGRSAEIQGESVLIADRLARVLQIETASKAAVDALPEASRAVLEAYAAGVNARLARIRQGTVAPPQRLGQPIQNVTAWAPADSLAVVKLLSWCMGGTLETTLVLDGLIQRLDSVPARPFFPGGSSVDFGVAPDLPESPNLHGDPASRAGASAQPTRMLCRGIGIPTGGAWVVGARATESRAPILVADWHVEPSVPALFYEAQIEAGEIDVAGVTIPGSPIVWMGRNRLVAWAGVPASAPVSDLFIETLREDRGLYQNGSLWVPLETHEETIRWRDVHGNAREGVFSTRRTRHGPLIEAVFEPDEGGVETAGSREIHRSARALAWTGARKGDGLTSMLGLLRAREAADVVTTLEDHHEPVLAVAFADRNGEGGVQVAGWLAKRPLPTGLVPVQGRLRSFDWRARVPQSELPQESLADAGSTPWVIAADQSWPERRGLDQLEWLWRPGNRAARLEEALLALSREGKIDLRMASDLLTDDLAPRAPRVVAAVLGLARRAGPLPREASEIASLLERWDGSMAAESSGAATYHLVLEHLLETLLREPFGDALFDRYLEAPHVRPQIAIENLVLRAAKLRRPGGWTDEARVSEAARTSLRRAWVSLNHRLGPTRARWTWGGLHTLKYDYLGPGKPLVGPLAVARPASGTGQTMLFSSYRPGVTFEAEQAGMIRMALDLASPDHLLSALSPGQSEHPGHRHFLDGAARWSSQRLSLFATRRLVIEEEGAERLLLEPSP